ncbi:MAG TPA: hypothetical protein PKC28_12025 [Bdellovibrionales bacterium]|nr:hypothetical protein [Bdellovibrionales bacterium]
MLPESDLWVLPPAAHSAWFARLDWYLNWQMSQGQAHAPRRPSPTLQQIAKEHGVRADFVTIREGAPLLVSSRGLLPAEKCVVLPYHDNVKDWMHELGAIAEQLGAAKVTVFLPAEVKSDAAAKHWSKSLAQVNYIHDDEVPE